MQFDQAVKAIEKALTSSLDLWPGFDPGAIPLVVYDADRFVFINHSNPPADRPTQLTAATATVIQGILTATVPVEMFPDEASLVPAAIHECFHVYQGSGVFEPGEGYDFFQAFAVYPELDAEFRAICRAEVEVLNQSGWPERIRGQYLAALAQRRYSILCQRKEVLPFEKSLERLEGTANYVGQRVQVERYNFQPGPLSCVYGPYHTYSTGPAVCCLLDRLVKNWQARIESGEIPSEILMNTGGTQDVDLAALRLPEKISQEEEQVNGIRREYLAQLHRLEENNPIHLELSPELSIQHSFNPVRITALGDGRLIHNDFLIVQLPDGEIHLRGGGILEDTARHELIFPHTELDFANGSLAASTSTAQISLQNVVRVGENRYKVLPPGFDHGNPCG